MSIAYGNGMLIDLQGGPERKSAFFVTVVSQIDRTDIF